uniref:Tapasin-like n=1 Tax=Gouania willdenowi TaxID=441366 RepID=A0A8C5GU83_GOUWI
FCNFLSLFQLSLLFHHVIAYIYVFQSHGSCPVLECWFMKEKVGGGLSGGPNQDKSLLYVHKHADSHRAESHDAPLEVNPDRLYFVTDPAATLCHRSLNPRRGSSNKPMCEINPLHPQPSTLELAVPLTEPALSPIYLHADWLSTALQSFDKTMSISAITRAPTGTKEHDVILTLTTKTVLVQSRLGAPVLLDCSFWANPSSPLTGTGFAVEWRYQFRGDGRLVLAYDGKSDRLSHTGEEGATLDFEALHGRGNASLILQEAKVHHSGIYICSVYLPYLQAQVAMELQVVEPPSLSIHPSPLPLTAQGQTINIQCEASGFAPLSLDLHWEFKGADGKTKVLGSGSLSSHRQLWDGTYTQSSRLELDTADLGRAGEVACVGVHPGGTRRVSVEINLIGFSSPSIEDSMAMVGVALVLYGLIKLVSWSFSGSGNNKTSLHFPLWLLWCDHESFNVYEIRHMFPLSLCSGSDEAATQQKVK